MPPGRVATAASARSAHRASPASSTRTSSSDAPFCGPYTAAAPDSPSSGLSTSEASQNSTPGRSRSRDRSSEASRPSAAPPGGSSRPASSASRAPSAWTRPAPPSVVATPPTPSTIRLAPIRSAARISSPTPRLVAVSGASSPGGSSVSPHACAASMTAVPSSSANDAVTAAPTGPPTSMSTRSVARRHRGVDRAVPAVGHRHRHDLAAEAGQRQPGRHPGGHVAGGQAALELIRCHHDALDHDPDSSTTTQTRSCSPAGTASITDSAWYRAARGRPPTAPGSAPTRRRPGTRAWRWR